MPTGRHYDTVAFDVREDALLLLFASTTSTGDIDDYLLLMRAVGEDFDDDVYLEINEQQLAGYDLIREVRLTGNVMTLKLFAPAAGLDGVDEIVLTFEDTAANRAGIEAGAIRILGEKLAGGHA